MNIRASNCPFVIVGVSLVIFSSIIVVSLVVVYICEASLVFFVLIWSIVSIILLASVFVATMSSVAASTLVSIIVINGFILVSYF